jgi:5-methyltetrahydrofolate--homocysteine methyltransferase
MMTSLQALLQTQDYLVADGGMGTTLMKMGLGHGAPPEEWNLLHPERICSIHRAYIEAGSQIVLTNSFGGTCFRLGLHKLQDRVHQLNAAAAKLARAEADAAGRPVIVAGSMGPSGEILEPLGERSFDEAKAGFAEQAAALAEGGVDVLWIETMSDLAEVAAAAEGVRQATDLPLVITMTFDTNGHTMMGVGPAQAVQALQKYSPLAVGGNCGNGVEELQAVIQQMYATDQTVPLVAKSNAGVPKWIDGAEQYSAGPEEMAGYAVQVRNLGATIIGGCCGSTPEHIRLMAGRLKATPLERVGPSSNGATPAPRPERRSRRRARMTNSE